MACQSLLGICLKVRRFRSSLTLSLARVCVVPIRLRGNDTGALGGRLTYLCRKVLVRSGGYGDI